MSSAVSTRVRLPALRVLSLPAAMAAYNDVRPSPHMRTASAMLIAKGIGSVIGHLSRSPRNARSVAGLAAIPVRITVAEGAEGSATLLLTSL